MVAEKHKSLLVTTELQDSQHADNSNLILRLRHSSGFQFMEVLKRERNIVKTVQ